MVRAFRTGGGLELVGAVGCPTSQFHHLALLGCFQDTWVFPNILLFYPEAARAILEYRIRMLEGALRNAEEQGYKVGTGLLGWGQRSPASVTQQDSSTFFFLYGSIFSQRL